MDELDVETFLSKLRTADTEKKVDLIQEFTDRLGQTDILPESTFDALTLAIAPLIRTSSNQLLAVILTSFLPSYIPHISTDTSSSQVNLRVALNQFLPPSLERLNDPKERVHAPAGVCVGLLGKKCYQAEPAGTASTAPIPLKGKEKETLVGFWERHVKDIMAVKGKAWRGKVEGMKVILELREDKDSGLPLKPWLGTLVDLLEDSDSHVRDQARETLVGILAPASTPPAAKSEVKKLLSAKGTRKTIADGILARIFATPGVAASSAPDLAGDDASSAGGGGRSRAPTPLGDEVAVVHIASAKDMDQEWSKMAVHFQGKETEHNWGPREKAIIRIRGMLRGHAYQNYPEAFLLGLKTSMIDGVSRTLLSLRTTVAQQSCAVIQELAEYLGSAFDPFVESLLAVLGKMAGFTKKIIAEKSQRALTSIITYTTCRPHIFISHITAGLGEKNVQTRQYCIAHLKTFLDTHASRSKVLIDTTPGSLGQLEDDVKRALADTTPQAREIARSAFWSFEVLWPAKGAEIMSKLDPMARKQLEKADPKSSEGVKSRVVASVKGPAKRPSVIAQLLAEKRKEKAAEATASRQETPRTVSSPAGVGFSRSVSDQQLSSGSPSPVSRPPVDRTITSPPRAMPAAAASVNGGSPSGSRLPRAIGSPKSPPRHSIHPRSPSLSHLPSSPISPAYPHSPLRTRSTVESGMRSPGSSSATSATGTHTLKTPVLARAPLPAFGDIQNGSNAIGSSPSHMKTPGIDGLPPDTPGIDPELQAQADQAVQAAQKLLDLDDSDLTPASKLPVTPARPPDTHTNGHYTQFRTPATVFLNGQPRSGPAVWEDSPRPESVTPQMLSKLRERKHEQSWWLRQKVLMDQASPLREMGTPSNMVVHRSADALTSGPDAVTMLDLQKLCLFAKDHPVQKTPDEDDRQEALWVWDGGALFDTIADGLLAILDPSVDLKILEQALVLLWELVQNQWTLFESREMSLLDALFRLRGHRNNTVLESTNSLISLLVEISDPIYFLSILRGSYDRFIAQHPSPEERSRSNGKGNGSAVHDVKTASHARSSGELFGLTAFGMCFKYLPREAARIEGAKLAPVVMQGLASKTITTRQAANTIILAIQAVLVDAQATVALFPELDDVQKDLVFYLMDKNGVLGMDHSSDHESAQGPVEDGKEALDGKLVELLGKGVRS
ncbi:clasp N terminal-domain-containing protein [Kockovaella imperatae]|uniref:Clasp N terminal-domain-containing protein n=1 Tax=Kockovaella imperatae TaxID=4999 RepID=A0A1Y1UAL6_9TREE|nr:clasp N terminal-domain-containing protein [Kockovaella imperatae]ORX34125.1 clasp N terminal-domain-containing protein [Kockovaella imperatae]